MAHLTCVRSCLVSCSLGLCHVPCVVVRALRCDESLAHLVRVVVLVSCLSGLCHGPCVVAGALRCDESLAHLARAVVLVSCLPGHCHGPCVVARALRCDESLAHQVCVCVCLCVCVCAFASVLLARPLAWGHVSSWTVCGVTQVWLHMMCVRSSCFFIPCVPYPPVSPSRKGMSCSRFRDPLRDPVKA